MAIARSAARTWRAPASIVECTATVSTPSSRHAAMIRTAISPRLAISRRRIILGLPPRRALREKGGEPVLAFRRHAALRDRAGRDRRGLAGGGVPDDRDQRLRGGDGLRSAAEQLLHV